MPLFRDRKKEDQEAGEQAEPEDIALPAGEWMLRDGPLFAAWYMKFRLAHEVQRARRYGNALSILIAEPQLITDEHVQSAGTRAAAEAAVRSSRVTDLMGWMGEGSRIMAILPETDAPSGRFAVARLRDEMWLLSHSLGGHKWSIDLIDDLDRIAEIAEIPAVDPIVRDRTLADEGSAA